MNLNSDIILQTYELADMINASKEVQDYLQSKKELDNDRKVSELKKRLAKEKERLTEVERFGQFHPDYYQEKNKIEKTLQEINQNETVKRYKQTEKNLNELLYLVNSTIARSVTDAIIITTSNDIIENQFCTSGGCNSCGVRDSCPV